MYVAYRPGVNASNNATKGGTMSRTRRDQFKTWHIYMNRDDWNVGIEHVLVVAAFFGFLYLLGG